MIRHGQDPGGDGGIAVALEGRIDKADALRCLDEGKRDPGARHRRPVDRAVVVRHVHDSVKNDGGQRTDSHGYFRFCF